ncbi:MAG TPA: class I SAM-dependent methyltransferase [Pyrinomonadaceae bacterium]|jgi:SAM-dependent methyltransferase
MTEGAKIVQDQARARIREIAAEFATRGDDLGWFDAAYREAAGDAEKLPWGDLEPNKFFKAWAEGHGLQGDGRKALVVGCGLGDDARYLDDLGFNVTAFDLSPTAIEWAKRLHALTKIKFGAADLFHPPDDWFSIKTPPATAGGSDRTGTFDFVLEIYTIQPLPMDLRTKAIDSVASFVAPGGGLVVVSRGRGDDEELVQLPWPLSRHDLSRFLESGLTEIGFDDFIDEEDTRRFVVEYRRK